MTREAELRARDFVALVSGGVHAETEVGVAQRLLLQAQTALASYAEPGWAREHGWPQFADRLLELARAAQPGSDHQLAFVNTLCSSVLSTRHVVTLADLLDHDPADAGLGGPGDRYRPALAHRDRAGHRRRDRRRRARDAVHRRRGATRPDGCRQAARRPGGGGTAATARQGRGLDHR